jgi:ribosome biogenesis GTPase
MNTNNQISIEDLGYNSSFEAGKNRLGLSEYPVARVIAEHRGAYTVRSAKGECLAKITGRQMFRAEGREDYPAVGDWVAITEADGSGAVIHGVLPRQTILKRKYGDKNKAGGKDKIQVIATNIDVAFIVESVDRDFNLNRFERYFAIAQDGGVTPAIILNKVDLCSKTELDEKLSQLKSRFPAADVVLTSTISNEGLNELKQYIVKGKTYCFLGSSGVGKSSLINKLLGGGTIKTGDISSYSGRGRHITTARQMYVLGNGGIVVDNPGMREVGMADASHGIDSMFDDIVALAQRCKYADCTHKRESGCEVLRAVRSGRLDEKKYLNFLNLKKETEYSEMNDTQRREKDRQFGKFLKRAKEDLKKLGHKDY